jgi:hypothetical protein
MAILILNNETLINQNISDISTNTYDIILHDTRLDSVELKTRHQSSAYNTTIFDYTVQAVDCFGYNPIQGNCSVIRNKILITDIQAVNNTQTTDISNIQIVNTTQNGRLTAIEAVDATQTYDILANTQDINANSGLIVGLNTNINQLYTNNNAQNVIITQNTNDIVAIKSKTDKITINASEFEINNLASSVKLNQDLNMNNYKINNLPEIFIAGFGGYMQALCTSTSKFTFKSLLLGDIVNGSGFNFSTIKSGVTKNLSVDYNDLDLNNRTISNCYTIDNINTDVTALSKVQSSYYQASRGSFNTTGMTNPNLFNVWDTLNMDTLPGAFVGGSPNASGGRNGIRLTTAGVYKIIFSFSYATVSNHGSDWDITHRMRLNTADSTTYTPIIASRIFDIRGSGNGCYGADYTGTSNDNLILYANTANNWIMQYRTRTDSNGNTRPNRFSLCVSFSHSGVTSDYFLQTYSSQTRSLVDCRYILTYEAY